MTTRIASPVLPLAPSAGPVLFSAGRSFDEFPEIALKKGQVVLHEHNARQFVFLVTKGMIKISSFHDGREVLEDYVQAGELFNWEVLTGRAGEAWVGEALTNRTSVRKIPVAFLRKALQVPGGIAEEILRNMALSLHRTQARLRNQVLLSAQQRVIHFLIDYVGKSGRQVGLEYVVQPVLTHHEIGAIAGTGRQTATTVMNDLRRKGIIHFNRRYLIVRDLAQLLALT